MPKTITPKQPHGRNVWVCQFRHPLKAKGLKVSLSTSDESTAKEICRQLERLCDNPTFHTYEAAQQAGFDDKTLEIFFDKKPSLESLVQKRKVKFGDDDDIEFLRSALLGTPELGAKSSGVKSVVISEGSDGADIISEFDEPLKSLFGAYKPKNGIRQTFVDALLARRERQRIIELSASLDKASKELNALKPELENLRAENSRLRREQNVDVKISIGKAVEAWKQIYEKGHDATTVQQAFYAVDSFVSSLPHKADTNLGRVTVKDLDKWLHSLKKKTGGELSAVTRRKYRAYTGPFWKFAVKRYSLSENPKLKMDSVTIDRHATRIEAIRDLDDLNTLLDALKPSPYWRAWVATACLLGPRWAELAHIRLQDVRLPKLAEAQGAVRIVNTDDHTTKTGKERDVVVERGILLPILQDYVKNVRPNLKSDTPWLFPSTHYMETDNGAWTHWTFHLELKSEIEKAKARAKKADRTKDFWSFTSKEYRHTAGTLLFLNGWSAFQISRHLGNSAAVCERYYCSGTYSGRPIGLQF